jgi:hypothetical protein
MANARVVRPEIGLRDALRKIAKKHELRLVDVITNQLLLTVQDLKDNTPVDTGAGAGDPVRARRAIYKSHPGFGRKIGNEVGDTGWQLSEKVTASHWAVVSPMWGAYLREVNYTHPTHANFLENAVQRLRDRLNKESNRR